MQDFYHQPYDYSDCDDRGAEEEHAEAVVKFTQDRLANTGFALTKAGAASGPKDHVNIGIPT